MFKLNTKIIWQANDNDSLMPTLKSGTVTKVGKDVVWVDNAHKPEDCIYAAFCYPDTEECRAHIMECVNRARIRKEEDRDYMTRTYQLNNKLVLAGEK